MNKLRIYEYMRTNVVVFPVFPDSTWASCLLFLRGPPITGRATASTSTRGMPRFFQPRLYPYPRSIEYFHIVIMALSERSWSRPVYSDIAPMMVIHLSDCCVSDDLWYHTSCSNSTRLYSGFWIGNGSRGSKVVRFNMLVICFLNSLVSKHWSLCCATKSQYWLRTSANHLFFLQWTNNNSNAGFGVA